MSIPIQSIVDEESIHEAIDALCVGSPTIRVIVEEYGTPPLWRREPGFASLVYTILEQQVSLASARAVYERLVVAAGELTPKRFLELDPAELRSIGFSRQKTEYCTDLATTVAAGNLDLEALEASSDDEVRARLTSLRGIGRWTADVYLLHSLGRADIWPTGDLALAVAVQEALSLETRPSEEDLLQIGAAFSPWRSVAARIFWHRYLSIRGVYDVT